MAWPRCDNAACVNGSGSPDATRNCACTRSTPTTALGHRVLDLQPRVHLEEVEPRVIAAAFEQEFAGAGVSIPHRFRRGNCRRAHALAHRRAQAPHTGSPRPSSDAGVAPSIRARTDAPCCRARRQTPGSPRGAGARSAARHTSVSSPNDAPCFAPRRRQRVRRPRSIARTAFMPMPPPPADGLMSAGYPIRSMAERSDASD